VLSIKDTRQTDVMKHLALGLFLVAASACATLQGKYVWRVRDVALAPTPTVAFQAGNQTLALTMNTQTVQKLLLAHIRITRAANVQAELLIVEGSDPNAFVGLINGRRVVAINTGMIKLIGDDIDEYGALLGHETAHWARGHVHEGERRSSTLQGMSTLAGMGLGAVGVPAAGLITGFGADLIEASYSRDDEREADAFGVVYMRSAGFDPQAALRLYEKLHRVSSGSLLPFLNTHPSGEERIKNLKALIESRPAEAPPL
jgi:predicted Zn-dependent protease